MAVHTSGLLVCLWCIARCARRSCHCHFFLCEMADRVMADVAAEEAAAPTLRALLGEVPFEGKDAEFLDSVMDVFAANNIMVPAHGGPGVLGVPAMLDWCRHSRTWTTWNR